jgi:hypothetical protein
MTTGTPHSSDRRGFLRVLVGATTAALLLVSEPAEADQEDSLDGGTPTS